MEITPVQKNQTCQVALLYDNLFWQKFSLILSDSTHFSVTHTNLFKVLIMSQRLHRLSTLFHWGQLHCDFGRGHVIFKS
jgi:hypothetical protein